MQKYDKLDLLPRGEASDKITHGCLIVEGGALRGMYCQGVLDTLMENDLNFDCVIGVSSGAMNAINYMSGQIGRGAYLTLKYRPDSRFIGFRALIRERGITGFRYMWSEVQKDWPINEDKFNDNNRRFLCVATNLNTGKPRYFEKETDVNFLFGIQAGASIPFGSKPVMIENEPYLDGGISVHVPYKWALRQGYEKIVVIRTRERDYKATSEYHDFVVDGLYKRKYPNMVDKLKMNSFLYNKEIDDLTRLENEGRLIQIAPSRELELTLFCNDLEQLAELYYLGYYDAKEQLESVKEYLGE